MDRRVGCHLHAAGVEVRSALSKEGRVVRQQVSGRGRLPGGLGDGAAGGRSKLVKQTGGGLPPSPPPGSGGLTTPMTTQHKHYFPHLR